MRGLLPGRLAPAGGHGAEDLGAARRDRLGAGRRPADGGLAAAHGAGAARGCWPPPGRRCASRPTGSAPTSATATCSASSPALLGDRRRRRPAAGPRLRAGPAGAADRGRASWRRTEGRPVRRGLAAAAGRRAGRRTRLGLVAGRRPLPAGASRGRAARCWTRCPPPAAAGLERGLARHGRHRLARRRRPAAHRGRPGAGPGPGARRAGRRRGQRRDHAAGRRRTGGGGRRARPGSSRSTGRCRPRRATTRRWR